MYQDIKEVWHSWSKLIMPASTVASYTRMYGQKLAYFIGNPSSWSPEGCIVSSTINTKLKTAIRPVLGFQTFFSPVLKVWTMAKHCYLTQLYRVQGFNFLSSRFPFVFILFTNHVSRNEQRYIFQKMIETSHILMPIIQYAGLFASYLAPILNIHPYRPMEFRWETDRKAEKFNTN